MGTGIANIPAGTLIFDMTNIDENTVGDGIPDIIVTQIADPSNSTDRYSFYDENNVRVGNEVPITFSSTNTSVPVIPSIGEWVGDFYDAIDMNLEGGSSNMTNGVRQLRMWAGDFVDFGITKANVSQVRKFQIRLSGNSDIAFVAYNENSFVNRSPIPMPVTLTKFQAKQHKGQVSLLWETASELNSSHFEVEVSENGRTFTKVGSVPAAGNTTLKQQYSFRQSLQRDGIYYYRLRQVDLDGTFEYSKTITVASNASNRTVSLYPNPTADDVVRLSHPMALGSEKITLIDLAGKHVLEQAVEQGSVETPLRISSLAKGIYQVVWRSAEGTEVRKLLRK